MAKNTKIQEIDAAEALRQSLEVYSKEVIEDRALPDFRDGLKPSQRRLLYYMGLNGITSDKHYEVAADVCSGTCGKFHPHGEASMFETAVNLQYNSITTIDGHGGWRDINADASAARYIKMRLSKFGDFFLQDLHVADYVPNYTGKLQEPVIIPAPIPYALLSGSAGIAVGTTQKIPGHNLTELVNAFIAILNGERDLDVLVDKYLKGPDSKLGGVMIAPKEKVKELYATGYGKIEWRCSYTLDFDDKSEEWVLIINGLPEIFRLQSWLATMTEYANQGRMTIQNECSKTHKIRFVIRFDNQAFFEDVIEKSLRCHENYTFNLIKREGERSEALSLDHFDLLKWVDSWLDWREEVEIKIVKDRIGKLEKDLYREEIKSWAVDNIDAIVELLKKSNDPLPDLMKKFKLAEEQARIIAEMQLQAISRLSKERQDKLIARIKGDLKSETAKLEQPKILVENSLRALLQFDETGRLSTIDYGDTSSKKAQKALAKFEGKPVYWAIERARPNYMVDVGSELPLRKRTMNQYIGIVNASGGVITVSQKGVVSYWRLSELTEGDSQNYGKIAAFLPDGRHQYLAIACNTGMVGFYETKQSVGEWEVKLLQEEGDQVTSAAGFNDKDLIFVYNENQLQVWDSDELYLVSRSNKTGTRGLSNTKGRKDIELLVIPKGYTLVFPSFGEEYSFKQLAEPTEKFLKHFFKSENFYLYNPADDEQPMLVIMKDGTRQQMTGKQLAKLKQEDAVETYFL